MHGLLRRTLITALVAAAGAAFAAAPASAAVLVKSAPDCNSSHIEKPFTRWGDNANYFLTPSGDFENGSDGWDLNGGARVVGDNESWKVNGDGSGALQIPAGATVSSPTVCVGLDHPTIRLFAKRTSGLPLLASLAVSVQAETSLGLPVTVPVNAVLLSTGSWSQSGRMLIVANLLPLLPGELTPIRLNSRRCSARSGSMTSTSTRR
jgi:hypothetical protein